MVAAEETIPLLLGYSVDIGWFRKLGRESRAGNLNLRPADYESQLRACFSTERSTLKNHYFPDVLLFNHFFRKLWF